MIRKEAFYTKVCNLKCALQNTPKITIMETDIRKEVECI